MKEKENSVIRRERKYAYIYRTRGVKREKKRRDMTEDRRRNEQRRGVAQDEHTDTESLRHIMQG